MITKDDFLNAEFLKQFKDFKEFATFMEEFYVRRTEKVLEAEINTSESSPFRKKASTFSCRGFFLPFLIK